MLDPLLALPWWIWFYGLVLLILVFLSPSWLPGPDPSLKLQKVFYTWEEASEDPTISREIRDHINLPHDWRVNSPPTETGWYEILFQLDEPPTTTQVIYISHVQQRATVWLDETPLSNNVPEYVVDGRIWSRPMLLRLPEESLHPGYHRILIYLESNPPANALLGDVYLGAENEIRPYWEWRYHYRFTLVAVITFGMLSLSLFMGVLWLLRKKDTMYAWFTACTLFWSLHNLPHIINKPGGVSEAIWDGVYFMLLGWMVVALVIFNHRYTGRRFPVREKALLLFAGLGALPFFFLPLDDLHRYGRLFWDLSLLPVGGYTLYYLAQAHLRQPLLEIRLLLMAGLIIFTLGLNDYLVTTALIERTRGLMIHYSGLPAMLVLIWFLLSRFLKVLAEAELLNEELEQRVQLKEQELQDNFERMKSMEQEQVLTEERSRIMQDVHDGVGGQLVAMLAELETGKVSQKEVQGALSQSLTDLRLVIDSLDTASEDIPTLLGMLRTRLQPRLDGHDIQLHWKVSALPPLENFGPQKALNLMRILQEIFVNALKHSHAKNIYLETRALEDEKLDHHIEILIHDDGGWHEASDNTGRGLRNMQRRAESIDAELRIDGQADGTTVKLVL